MSSLKRPTCSPCGSVGNGMCGGCCDGGGFVSTSSAAHADLGYVEHAAGESLDMRFAAFVRARPDVVRLLVSMARELRDAGETRIGMKMLIEVARYKHLVRRSAGHREPWLLNNSYSSRLARLIEDNYRDLKGLFETRALAGERVIHEVS